MRKRLESSGLIARILARVLTAYLRLCWGTGKWISDGEPALDAALEEGPVTVICWHGRLVVAPVAWAERAPAAIPRDPSPAGRLSAATQAYLGTQPFEIDMAGGNFGPVRQVMKLVRGGASLGLTADGPKGPNRKAKRAAIDWARATGRPIFLFAWSSRRVLRLNTWDRLMIPVPFAGGAFVYQPWAPEIPRKPGKEDYRRLRDELGAALDDVAHSADRLAGRSDALPRS